MITLREGLQIDPGCIRLIEHHHSVCEFLIEDGKSFHDLVRIYFEIGHSMCERTLYYETQDEAHAMVKKLNEALPK